MKASVTHAWDATGMPVVLRDSAGNRYLYGLDLISVSDSANKKFYYHTDGLGSTTAITGSTGAVVKTYQYDAYGAVRTQTGTQPNEFTFTGEQVDSSGLQYLRARYYDGATGRFADRDPLPLMQRYAYVGGNPVNLTDPSGLCWVCSFPMKPSVQSISDWTDQRLHEMKKGVVDPAVAALVYTDLNVTVCIPGRNVCGSAGVQLSLRDGFHPYAGTGLGVGAGLSATWAPGQRITGGWSCGLQTSVDVFSAQFGGSGIARNKKGMPYESPFVEVGGGLGALDAYTCVYIF